MKTLILLFLLSVVAQAADPATNQLHRIKPRHLRQQTNMPPTPQQTMLGPRYDVAISPGTGIIIISTNTFTATEARQWLQEAIRTLK